MQGAFGVSNKGPEKQRAALSQTGRTRFGCVHTAVQRRGAPGAYLGMENRDAASFFLIFLHSVGHLGGDSRLALWETRSCVGGETNRGGGWGAVSKTD